MKVFKDIYRVVLLFVSSDKKSPTKREKYTAGFITPLVILSLPFLRSALIFVIRERNETKERLRCFRPAVTESFWGKTTTWTERERPLTDEQLKERYGFRI